MLILAITDTLPSFVAKVWTYSNLKTEPYTDSLGIGKKMSLRGYLEKPSSNDTLFLCHSKFFFSEQVLILHFTFTVTLRDWQVCLTPFGKKRKEPEVGGMRWMSWCHRVSWFEKIVGTSSPVVGVSRKSVSISWVFRAALTPYIMSPFRPYVCVVCVCLHEWYLQFYGGLEKNTFPPHPAPELK